VTYTDPQPLDVVPDDKILVCADGKAAVIRLSEKGEEGVQGLICKTCGLAVREHNWSA